MAMNSRPNREAPVAPTVGAEMRKMSAEPLLPIEKKLIGWSLGLGIVLLVVLVTIAKMVLPAS
jgi:hypothetical protein